MTDKRCCPVCERVLPLVATSFPASANPAYQRMGLLCRSCIQTLSPATFSAIASRVHSGRYTYLENCVETWPLATIHCKEHGDFTQRARSHVLGCGCPMCGRATSRVRRQLTLDEFARRVHARFGDKFDLSRVQLHGAHKKVEVICRQHGPFWITPYHLYTDNDCPVCANEQRRESHLMTQADFLARCMAAHGDRYDYSHVVFTGTGSPVEVVCRQHGSFWVVGSNHIYGRRHGCPRCGFAQRGKKRALTTECFIAKARAIHGEKYDYSRSVYLAAKKPIIVICQIHGEFVITPDNHLRGGSGCLSCLASRGEEAVAQALTRLEIPYERQKRFPDCRDKRVLPFDFYFVHDGLEYLVEYDGQQHFIPWTPGKSSRRGRRPDQTVEAVQRRDKIKDAFASSTGRRMIRIRYDTTDVEHDLLSAIGDREE